MIKVYELYQTDTFRHNLKKLDKKTKKALKKILNRLLENPARFKALKGLSGHYRLRIGPYRVAYKQEGKRITLLFIKKRDIAYKRP